MTSRTTFLNAGAGASLALILGGGRYHGLQNLSVHDESIFTSADRQAGRTVRC